MAAYQSEKFESESGYYDVEAKDASRHYCPDVEASSSDAAIEKMAAKWGILPQNIVAYQASNPGYREQ